VLFDLLKERRNVLITQYALERMASHDDCIEADVFWHVHHCSFDPTDFTAGIFRPRAGEHRCGRLDPSDRISSVGKFNCKAACSTTKVCDRNGCRRELRTVEIEVCT